MLDNITTGSTINIKVVKQPTSEAARKTLVRLLSKDADAVADNKRLKDTRKANYNPQPRGGRLYSGRMPKIRNVKGNLGETGTIKATYDVIKDLGSVAKFLEISAA